MLVESLLRQPFWRRCLIVVSFALVPRAAFVVWQLDGLEADPDAYKVLAENVWQNGVFGFGTSPTAYRPPLYPLLLTVTLSDGRVSVLRVAVLHVVLGSATVVMTYWLADAWGLAEWSWITALLVAVDPILLNQSSVVMTETLATFLTVAALLALTKAHQMPSLTRAAIAGGTMALASLCRPTFLPWLLLSSCALALGSNASGRRWQQPLACLLAAAMVLAPWVMRNALVFGAPKLTTTHGGYTVLLGNNPSFYGYLKERQSGEIWDAEELATAWSLRGYSTSPQDAMWNLPVVESDIPRRPLIARDEVEDDGFAYALARRYIQEAPRMFAYSCLVRVGRLWQVTPHRVGADESRPRHRLRWLTGCWYAVTFLLAAAGAIAIHKRLLRPPLLAAVLLCVVFTGVHAFYWSNMRMRAPLMPFVYVLTAFGMAAARRWAASRKP